MMNIYKKKKKKKNHKLLSDRETQGPRHRSIDRLITKQNTVSYLVSTNWDFYYCIHKIMLFMVSIDQKKKKIESIYNVHYDGQISVM